MRVHTPFVTFVLFCGYSLLFGQAKTPDLSGIYWATQYNAKIQLVGGGDLPLTAAGRAAYEKNMAGLKDGSVVDSARKYCVPDGLPRVLATPYPFEIFQGPPGLMTFVYDLNHQVRLYQLDNAMPIEIQLLYILNFTCTSVDN